MRHSKFVATQELLTQACATLNKYFKNARLEHMQDPSFQEIHQLQRSRRLSVLLVPQERLAQKKQ
jgi:hypothetical protein